jgi:hypothetical protein
MKAPYGRKKRMAEVVEVPDVWKDKTAAVATDPLAHLERGAVREGGAQHPRRIDAALHGFCDSPRQHLGLAGPRRRKD